MFENNSKEFSASLPLKVAIIGAGISGLATAIALLKKGFDVQVYEQAQALQPVGAGLTLLPSRTTNQRQTAITKLEFWQSDTFRGCRTSNGAVIRARSKYSV